jgi:hypothetical protein
MGCTYFPVQESYAGTCTYVGSDMVLCSYHIVDVLDLDTLDYD